MNQLTEENEIPLEFYTELDCCNLVWGYAEIQVETL